MTTAAPKFNISTEDKKISPRAIVLRQAESLVCGDRNAQYGDPNDDFRCTASFWETYLRGIVGKRGDLRLEPHDVAMMMSLLKISRSTWSPDKLDTFVDLIGYGACAVDCVNATYPEIQAQLDEIQLI